MARTTTTAQDTALAATDRRTYVRVKVEDPDGSLVDVGDLSSTDFFDQAIIEASSDAPISRGTFSFWRAAGALSLSPLMEGSTLNRDSGSSYAPLINPGRQITVEVATLLPSATLTSGDWVLIWDGLIDDLDWGAERITVHARDRMAQLNDTIIESVSTYGADNGSEDITEVMQEILDDTFGASVWPLTTIGTPAFAIMEYELGNVSVLDALKALADLIGWNLHYRWDESESEFRLTLYEPDRSSTAPTYTFNPDDYYTISNAALGVQGIRNKGEVVYTDTSGDYQSVTDTRSTSVGIYGTRFIRLDAQGTSILTATQANNLLAALLDDLEDPKAVQTLEAAFHWPIELGDIHTYAANGVHYDTAQNWACFAYTHTIAPDRMRTMIQAAGKPSGGFRRWHQKARPDLRRTVPAVEVTFDANGETVVSAAGDANTVALYVTVGDGSEPATPTSASNDGVINGRSGTVSTGVKVTTGNDAYVKVVATDESGEPSPVRATRQARRTGPFHKDTTTRAWTGTTETTLETITIPANVLGTDGRLELDVFGLVSPNVAGGDTETVRFKIEGSTFLTYVFDAITAFHWRVILCANGGTSSQRLDAVMWGTTVAGPIFELWGGTQSQDSTTDLDITITVQGTDSGDQGRLDATYGVLVGTD